MPKIGRLINILTNIVSVNPSQNFKFVINSSFYWSITKKR